MTDESRWKASASKPGWTRTDFRLEIHRCSAAESENCLIPSTSNYCKCSRCKYIDSQGGSHKRLIKMFTNVSPKSISVCAMSTDQYNIVSMPWYGMCWLTGKKPLQCQSRLIKWSKICIYFLAAYWIHWINDGRCDLLGYWRSYLCCDR